MDKSTPVEIIKFDEEACKDGIRLLKKAMKRKLNFHRIRGKRGWQDKVKCSNALLSRLLRECVEKGDPVDVANFCMMLHARGEKIAASDNAATEPPPTSRRSPGVSFPEG